MVAENTETRIWVCPICTEGVEVQLVWRAKGVSLIRVLHVDDMDARLHMAWHQMCTCVWDEQADRHQGVDCPMHP